MLTRLGYYADKILEMGWLGAAVFVPLFFNVYSSRVFEPDKISLLRSLVLVMTAAWIVKLLEGGYRMMQRNSEAGSNGSSAVSGVSARTKFAVAAEGAAKAGLPQWLGVLRVPMLVPIFVYVLAYLLSTIFTVTTNATLWGSYQRLQGTYSQYSYVMLALIIIANMRTRAQFERLINFMLLTSVPVAMYGIIQAFRLDPLPWAGDTATRVASSMGNAIFVAAWLIIVVPFSAYRLFTGLSATIAARSASGQAVDPPAAPITEAERRRARLRATEVPSYGWAAVMAGLGVILIQLFFFLLALRIVAGLPFPDASMWWVLPLALIVFYAGCHALEWLGNHRDDPVLTRVVVPIVGVGLFLVSAAALLLTWAIEKVGSTGSQRLEARIGVDGGGFLWVLFFMLLWGTVGAGAYALAATERISGDTTPERGVMRVFLNIGYGLLFVIQAICIYLSQSRGPWLGFGAAFVTFAVAMWLVGRRSGTRWMARIGGGVSAASLVLALFVGALNIPDSPLKGLDKAPIIGRGIERLSTLTQTDVGTGKVRELIWKGATDLILSDPVRAVIGWGPESMYVAYNPFYPPELAQVELRNATPDRSHNVEFDQMVTLGVVGLLAYYFLVGSFFFLAVKALKRAEGVRDQLILITLISAMAAHFVEIQTGIQIAATWTYFYFLISALVVFAYFLNPYLLEEPRPLEATANVPLAAPVMSGVALPAEEARPVAAGKAASRGAATMTVAAGGNGRGAHNATAAQAQNKGKTASAQQGANGGAPSRGGSGLSAEARRRQQIQASRGYSSSPREWVKNPAMLALYAVLAVGALILTFTWNEAGVQADTLYKQGQAYDNAQRWPEAITFYQRAINLQPDQDYYYLFLGRSWLEFAKQATQEQQGNLRTQVRYPTGEDTDPKIKASNDALRKKEQLYRLQQSEQILSRAHTLNPLNSDHYANLGRLYLWWGSPAPNGGDDPSKLPLAVQQLELASQRTPGNAQIRDELAVAHSYNGQFDKAIEALNYSQNSIDPTYARTPFIKAQLYQDRVAQVRNDIATGKPLPAQGEADYGKLAVEMGKAYSDTIRLDFSTVIDQSFKARVDALIQASQPITGTVAKTSISAAALSNVLTDTVTTALRNTLPAQEKSLAVYLRDQGVYTGTADLAPSGLLQKLYNDPKWAGVKTDGGAKEWLDANMVSLTHNTSLVNYALGYIYGRTGRSGEPNASYTRALALEPTNQLVTQEVQK